MFNALTIKVKEYDIAWLRLGCFMVGPLTLALEGRGSRGRVNHARHGFKAYLCGTPHDERTTPSLSIMACKLAIDGLVGVWWILFNAYL